MGSYPYLLNTRPCRYMTDPVTVDLIGESKVKIADTITMLSVNVPHSARRSVLVDVLTVYGKASKAIVFTQVHPPSKRYPSRRDRSAFITPLQPTLTCLSRAVSSP